MNVAFLSTVLASSRGKIVPIGAILARGACGLVLPRIAQRKGRASRRTRVNGHPVTILRTLPPAPKPKCGTPSVASAVAGEHLAPYTSLPQG